METIYTKTAPDAIGPYSQAIKVGNTLYSSGQIAINPATGKVEAADIEGQSRQVMQNLAEVLKAAGASFDNVVKKQWAITSLQEAVLALQNCQRAFS